MELTVKLQIDLTDRVYESLQNLIDSDNGRRSSSPTVCSPDPKEEDPKEEEPKKKTTRRKPAKKEAPAEEEGKSTEATTTEAAPKKKRRSRKKKAPEVWTERKKPTVVTREDLKMLSVEVADFLDRKESGLGVDTVAKFLEDFEKKSIDDFSDEVVDDDISELEEGWDYLSGEILEILDEMETE